MPEISTAAVPVLDTLRLTLHGHRLDDFADSAALWGDPQVTRYVGGSPLSPEDVWSRLLRYVGHWSALGFGYWVVRERGSGSFIGEVGFADYKRDIEPGFGGAPEIGWVLAAAAHGQGFATEAVAAVVAWGDRHLAAARTVCMIDPENLASLRVAAKCGYAEYGRANYQGQTRLLLERFGDPAA